MFHVPAHKNVKHPAGQVSGQPAIRKLYDHAGPDSAFVRAIEEQILDDIAPWSDIDEFFNCIRACGRLCCQAHLAEESL